MYKSAAHNYIDTYADENTVDVSRGISLTSEARSTTHSKEKKIGGRDDYRVAGT